MVVFGYTSIASAQFTLRRLEALGYVQRGPTGRLAFTGRISGDIKLLGSVSAGFPSPAEEETVDLLNLTDFLVRRREATYILKVDGDSMIDALIGPGDLLIVERGRNPKNGDIVVAAVDGDWTVKYFEKNGRTVRLVPANKKYRPIIPNESMEIGGIVRAVIRKYGV
jgi:repressor LexA